VDEGVAEPRIDVGIEGNDLVLAKDDLLGFAAWMLDDRGIFAANPLPLSRISDNQPKVESGVPSVARAFTATKVKSRSGLVTNRRSGMKLKMRGCDSTKLRSSSTLNSAWLRLAISGRSRT